MPSVRCTPWQDARGSLPHSKTENWVQYLTRETGCLAAVGFGLATHAYNLAAGLVPPAAATCCTIGDYLAMRLCGLAAPRMDDSNAASIGFFDAERCAFDQNALQKAGIDPNFVPQLAAEPVIGTSRMRLSVPPSVTIKPAFCARCATKPPKCL